MPTPRTCLPLTSASAPNSLLSLHTHPFALRVVTAENQNIASLLKKPAADAETSPHMPMRPVTPEEKKHDLFDMVYLNESCVCMWTVVFGRSSGCTGPPAYNGRDLLVQNARESSSSGLMLQAPCWRLLVRLAQ